MTPKELLAELDAAGNVQEWLGPCARDARIDDCREAPGAP